ncbi:hypothetical protein NBCG_04498, partial [Nocardioidaceae bacterium Broad-1]
MERRRCLCHRERPGLRGLRRMSAPAGRPTLTVCRGCCCGTERKSPGVDHAAVLSTLNAAAGESATVRVADCLGPCERADVVVVGPSTRGRPAGGKPAGVGRADSERSPLPLAEVNRLWRAWVPPSTLRGTWPRGSAQEPLEAPANAA